MECNAFEIIKEDDYNQVLIHHFFPPGKMKVDKIINPIPNTFKLDMVNSIMPLLFNRTETNQQYINLTLSDKIDNIPILKNEVYNQPESEKYTKSLIKDYAGYFNFVKHPDTVKIFRTELSRVGESTFAEIYVNCKPEKIKYKDYIPETKILGITIKFKDLVLSKILLEKILKPVEASSLATAGDKNEIVVDFRIAFTESQ